MAVAGVAGSLVTGEHLPRVVAFGTVVVVLAVLRRWAVERIALRPRPVVPAALAEADDEVRRMAASAGTSRPMVTLVKCPGDLGPVGCRRLAGAGPGPGDGGVSIIAWGGSIVLFLTACGWWWTNRSFGGLTPAAPGRCRRAAVAPALVGARDHRALPGADGGRGGPEPGLTVLLRVDPALPMPVYEQIRAQAACGGGRQRPDRRGNPSPHDPPARLGRDLGLSKGTIERAYELLEADGVVESRGRAGTFVRPRPAATPSAPPDLTDLHHAAEALAVIVRELGVDEADAQQSLRQALDRLR